MSIDLWIHAIELYTSRYTAEFAHVQSKKRREADRAAKMAKKSDDGQEGQENADEQENEDGQDQDQENPNNPDNEPEPDVNDIYEQAKKKGGKGTNFYDDGHAIGQLTPERVEKLRKLYWKAVRTCGRQFKAGRLWTKFVYFERQNGSPEKVLPIFNEILRIPMEDYNQQFTEMKEFVQDSADPCELITDEELKQICKDYLEDTNANLGIGDQGDQAYRLAKVGELSEDALEQVRAGIVEKRRELFKENEKIGQGFENQNRRDNRIDQASSIRS